MTTANGTEFKLADYDQNNGLVLKSYGESKDLVFDEPANCEEIYFLVISANGQSTLNVVANYDDDTQSDMATYYPQDWWSSYPSGTEAVYGISRIITSGESGYQTDEIDNRYQFRLYEYTLPTDKSKKIKSVTFTSMKSGSYPTILGIAKKGYMVPTGIGSVESEAGVREISGIYTINGVKLNAPQRGINIIKYTDGTAKKVMVK